LGEGFNQELIAQIIDEDEYELTKLPIYEYKSPTSPKRDRSQVDLLMMTY
jgi:hypothetical protein